MNLKTFSLLLALLVIAPVISAQIESNFVKLNDASFYPMYEYKFNIKEGWNLVPPSIWYGKGDLGCGAGFMEENMTGGGSKEVKTPQNQHINYAYIYIPSKGYVGGALNPLHNFNLEDFSSEDQKYIEEMEGGYSNEDDISISMISGSWIYSDVDCIMNIDQPIEMRNRMGTSKSAQENNDLYSSKIKLSEGWNVVSILPFMYYQGDSFFDYFKSCDIEKIASWDENSQGWDYFNGTEILIKPSEEELRFGFSDSIISKDHFFMTFLMRVSEDCTFKYSSKVENSYNPNPSSNCLSIMDNGPSDENIDLVYVTDYNNFDSFLEKVNQSLGIGNSSTGLFKLDPFKQSKYKFNIWVHTKKPINCQDISSQSCRDEIKAISEECSGADIVSIFSKEDFTSYASYENSIIYISNREEATIEPLLFSHEFGHAFAYFGDEYENSISTYDYQYRPNIDIEGCPKWCRGGLNTQSVCYSDYMSFKECLYMITNNLTQSYNGGCTYSSTLVDCDMGEDCDGGTGCYFNAKSLVSFRSTDNSIMRYYTQAPFEFSSIQKRIFLDKIEDYNDRTDLDVENSIPKLPTMSN